MSGPVFKQHDRVHATSGAWKGETGSVAAYFPQGVGNGAVAVVLLDRAGHDTPVHIPCAQLQLLPAPASPVDLTVVRTGLEFVEDQLDALVGKPYPDQAAVVHAIVRLRRVVMHLADQVEKLAQAGDAR